MSVGWLTTLGASAEGTSVGELELLGVVAMLMALALFATSRRTLRLRRSRPMVVLISGGWLAVGVGVLLGPGLLGIVAAERVQEQLTPALQAAMGWVGLMLGLQARREVLTGLPRWVWRVVGLDALVVGMVFGVAGILGVWAWIGVWDRGGVWWGASVLMCASAGWALETRSLVGTSSPPELEPARLAVRAGGTLSALVWILVLGLLLAFAPRDASGVVVIDPLGGAVRIAGASVAGVLIAFIGRFALRVAGKAPDARLAIFLGMVALSAGIAGQLGIPALAVAMTTGVVLANVTEAGVREFERFILRADLVVATLIALLAGLLLSPAIGVRELALGAGLAAVRLVAKPLVLRCGRPDEATTGALSIATVRQSPVALAIALSGLLLEPSELMARVLSVLVISGVLCAMLPALLSWSDQRSDAQRAVGVDS
ncbi:MAG: hypothetical protein Tsb0013_14260 [Phycisphaerales bacterium]